MARPIERDRVQFGRAIRQALGATFWRLRGHFVLLLLTTLGATAAELAPPLLLRRIIDDHLGANLVAGLPRLALLYLAALAVSSAFSFAQTMVTTVIGIVVAMVTLSPRLAAMTLLATPVVYLLATFFSRRIYRAQLAVRRSIGSINTFLQETFSGLRTLKVFWQEERIKDRFERPLNDNLRALNQEATYVAYFPCVMQVVRAITIAGVVWVGARAGLGDSAGITVGGLAAFADLIVRLFGPIESTRPSSRRWRACSGSGSCCRNPRRSGARPSTSRRCPTSGATRCWSRSRTSSSGTARASRCCAAYRWRCGGVTGWRWWDGRERARRR